MSVLSGLLKMFSEHTIRGALEFTASLTPGAFVKSGRIIIDRIGSLPPAPWTNTEEKSLFGLLIAGNITNEVISDNWTITG